MLFLCKNELSHELLQSNISFQYILVNSWLNSIVNFPGLSESNNLLKFGYVFLDGIHLYTIN